jgi:hypothetical protein
VVIQTFVNFIEKQLLIIKLTLLMKAKNKSAIDSTHFKDAEDKYMFFIHKKKRILFII